MRLAAGVLFLFLLRYNMKPTQRAELRSRIFKDLANNPDCYVRMMFVRMMVEALEIFSSSYFKEHFFNVLLTLAEDPVANIRMKVVSLLPQLKSQLWIPADKKLLTSLESVVRHLNNNEKDRDVLFVLKNVTQKLEEMDVKYEGQTVSLLVSKCAIFFFKYVFSSVSYSSQRNLPSRTWKMPKSWKKRRNWRV